MMSAEQTYRYTRECTKCGWCEERALAIRDAAFHLVPSRWEPCPNCSAQSWSGSLEEPKLTTALLLEWASDESLHLTDEDEELILADEEYIETMLNILDNELGLPHKRGIIIEAMCVMVYNNVNTINNTQSPDRTRSAERVLNELTKRKPLVIAYKNMVMGYVQKVVFPKLDIAI